MTADASTPRTRVSRVSLFVAIALAFSWSQWLAVVASQHRWIEAGIRLTPLPIFGPLVAAACVLRGREERRLWYRAITNWHVSPVLIALSVFAMPAVFALAMAFATAGSQSRVDVRFPSLATVAGVCAGMLVTAGIGEELGWRGYLLPELRKSLSAVAASAVIAVIWFVWHLPLFWVAGAAQRDIPAAAFVVGLASYSFILSWLMEASSSVVPAVLFHTSANVVFWLVMVVVRGKAVEPHFLQAYIGLIVVLGIVAAALLAFRDKS